MPKTNLKRADARSPDVKLNYSPQGATLRAFHRAKEWVRLLIGPLGSGKTHACIEELLWCIDHQSIDRVPMILNGRAYQVRRSRWAAVRNTYAELESTTITDFRELVCDEMGMGEVRMSAPPRWKYTYMKRDGTLVMAEVIFLAMDIPKDQKKARGLQLSGAWLNEMKELSKTNADMIQGRIGRYPPKSACPDRKKHMIGDSNAPDDDHWLSKLHKDWKQKLLPGWWFGIQPPGVVKSGGKWQMNPGAENKNNLDEDYYERQVAGKKESWIRKNLANEFVRHSDGQPVHPDFNEAFHVSDYELQPTPGLPLYTGLDFGRSPAMVVLQPQLNGQVLVLSEVIGENTSAKKFRKPVRRHIRKEYENYEIELMTGDPAGDYPGEQVEFTAIDIMNEEDGLEIMPAMTNDFEVRTGALDTLLTTLIDGEPSILVSPRCKTLIKGLSGDYQFRRLQVAGDDKFTNKPDKGPTSHVCEALHYGLMGTGEVGVSSTEDDDYNEDHDSYRPEYYE